MFPTTMLYGANEEGMMMDTGFYLVYPNGSFWVLELPELDPTFRMHFRTPQGAFRMGERMASFGVVSPKPVVEVRNERD